MVHNTRYIFLISFLNSQSSDSTSSVSTQIQASSEEVTANATQQIQEMKKMLEMIHDLQLTADQLAQATNQFKI